MEDMMRKIADLEKQKKDWELEKKKANGKKDEVRNKEVRRRLGAIDAKNNESRARSQLNDSSYHTDYGVQDSVKQSSQSSPSVYRSRHESQSKGGPKAKRSRSGNGRLTPAGSAKSNYAGIQGPYSGNPNPKSSSSYHNSAKKSVGLAEQNEGTGANKPTEKGSSNFYKNPQKPTNS